jgi:hypothetical protein
MVAVPDSGAASVLASLSRKGLPLAWLLESRWALAWESALASELRDRRRMLR